MQGTFAPGPAARLDAISNVPWDDRLVPENDRDTQKRMRHHREKEARYNAMSDDQQTVKPLVLPYPETPDRVFPSTPCYRMPSGGGYRFVFVVDTLDPLQMALHPALGGQAWGGAPQAQSRGYWIVPHFIYRDQIEVKLRRDHWIDYYEDYVTTAAGVPAAAGLPGALPSPKYDFDSSGLTAAGQAHDSYYVPGVPNTEPTAPDVKDPLFFSPFNKRAWIPFAAVPTPAVTYTIRPYPYNQPAPPFPQQVDPPNIYIPVGGVGVLAPPPQASLAVLPPTYAGQAGVDWILPDARNFEIGIEALKDACLTAEELDYTFALSVQGLRGASLAAVWNCVDPAYDVTDRSAVLGQFVKMYMEKFYSRVDVGSGNGEVEDVVNEALTMHEEFCKGWVSRHHRTLSAEVTAAGEAMLAGFYPMLRGAFPAALPITRTLIARYLRRHPDYSGEFAHCLYHYMTSLEQMRGNRNPSYRAMQTERLTHISAMKRLAAMMAENLGSIREEVQNLTEPQLLFDSRFIDWHYVAGQMPAHHREFDGFVNSFALYRTRTGGRANAFPPWQQMRYRG